MSGICGWFGTLPPETSADEVIREMSGPLQKFDGASATFLRGKDFQICGSSLLKDLSCAQANGYSAVIWGTPRFTSPELLTIAREQGSARALIAAYENDGAQCLRHIEGAFALALASDSNARLLLGSDRMAIHPILYAKTATALVFASTASALRKHPLLAGVVDPQALYHYFHFHMVPGPGTAFRDEYRLLPGQYLHLQSGKLTVDSYWQARFIENETHGFNELKDEFLSILTGAVGTMSNGYRTGAFLSGGTDSSTISGLLCKTKGAAADTFSIGFAEEGYDEMDFARIASKHFSTAQHEYYVKPEDIVSAVPKLAEIYDQPFGNSSSVPTYCCARFAKASGMDILLGGDGGDELFGGNDRYATQSLYQRYELLPKAIRKGLLEPLAASMPENPWIKPARQFRRLIEMLSTPMPDRLDRHNLLVRFGPENVFEPSFLRDIDLDGPRKLMGQVYDDSQAATIVNKMLAYDFKFTLADSDLPKVMKSCELAGIPVRFPMLDDELLAFSLRLSPDLKLKGTKLRYFFKEALRGFLPDDILTKSKHGFGLPFGPWLRSHPPLEALVMNSLSGLRTRGIVRTDFIDQLMTKHLAEHPGYYGTMAWIMMMLEQWFRHHVDATTT